MSDANMQSCNKKSLLSVIMLIISISVAIFLVRLCYNMDAQKQMIINHDKVIQKLEGTIEKLNKNYDNKFHTQSQDRKFKNRGNKKRAFDVKKELDQLNNFVDNSSNFISKVFDFDNFGDSLSLSSANSDYSISNTDDNREIKINLQDFDKEDIKVKVKNKMLWVSAEKNSDKANKDTKDGETKHHNNSKRRLFRFSVDINDPKSINDIKTSFDKSILVITIPKSKHNINDDKEFELKID